MAGFDDFESALNFESEEMKFEETAIAASEVEGAKQETGTKKKTDGILQEAKERFREKWKNDEEFRNKLNIYSNDIEVVNTIGSYRKPVPVQDLKEVQGADGKTETERKLVPVAGIVGFKIKNVGDKPHTFITKEWSPVDGKYVATEVSKTLNPNEELVISHTDLVKAVVEPEFSLTLKNGNFRKSGKPKKGDADSIFNMVVFFYNAVDGKTMSVHNSSKIVIDSDKDSEIKPEFLSTFGFLLNKTERKTGTRTKASSSAALANYIKELEAKIQQ